MQSLYKYVINKVDISRKRERLIYWILIAALIRISILRVSMNVHNPNDGKVGLRYNDESNDIVSDYAESTTDQSDEIDKSCHIPTDADYYENEKSEEYYEKSSEDNTDKGTGEHMHVQHHHASVMQNSSVLSCWRWAAALRGKTLVAQQRMHGHIVPLSFTTETV